MLFQTHLNIKRFTDYWLCCRDPHVSSVLLSVYSELLKKLLDRHEILQTSLHIPPDKVNQVDLDSYGQQN